MDQQSSATLTAITHVVRHSSKYQMEDQVELFSVPFKGYERVSVNSVWTLLKCWLLRVHLIKPGGGEGVLSSKWWENMLTDWYLEFSEETHQLVLHWVGFI